MGEVLTSSPCVEGVVIQPLKQIKDDRGMVLHMLRSDSPLYIGFGEIYFSMVYRDCVKAWKRHKRMFQHFAVPVGEIKLVIYDGREGSPTKGVLQVITTGNDNYGMIRIPPMVWYGFQGVRYDVSIIANCTNIAHDPDESERLPEDNQGIPFKWF